MEQKQIFGIVLIVMGILGVFANLGVLFMMAWSDANFTSMYPPAIAFVIFGFVLIATGIHVYRQEK